MYISNSLQMHNFFELFSKTELREEQEGLGQELTNSGLHEKFGNENAKIVSLRLNSDSDSPAAIVIDVATLDDGSEPVFDGILRISYVPNFR